MVEVSSYFIVFKVTKETFYGVDYNRVFKLFGRTRYKVITIENYIITFFFVAEIRAKCNTAIGKAFRCNALRFGHLL